MASIAFGEGPSGFSFEASLMISDGSQPSSRAVSSMDLPGPRLIPPAQLKRKCSREKTRDDKRSPPTSRHVQFSFDCRCSNRWSYGQWLENSWLERQPRFRCPLYHSVDRIGTGPQERYSGWFLGMQRNRLDPAADLLRVLPPRFGRSVERIVSPAGLPTKSLFPLYSPSPETSGERATPARLSPSRTCVTCGQDAHRPDS